MAASRHKILPDGRTIPAAPQRKLPILDGDIYKTKIVTRGIGKESRVDLGKWLADRLGQPDKNHGGWWTEETTEPGEILICMRDAEIFTEFWLKWG